MTQKELTNKYFDWLVDIVDPPGFRKNGYGKILRQLYSIDFDYALINDLNRIGDGLLLRQRFDDSVGFGSNMAEVDRPCSVLEVLIALSKKIGEDILGDPDNLGFSGMWFWIMIDNLGLNKLSGGRYDKDACLMLIERWMEREFEYNGKGSPFPLKNPTSDQRKAELAKQMMDYLIEHPEYYEG